MMWQFLDKSFVDRQFDIVSPFLMLKAIFVVNNEPVVVVSKYQMSPKNNELQEEACKLVRESIDPAKFRPVVYNAPHTFIMKKSGEVWLMAVLEGDAMALMYTSILDQLEEILQQYIEKPLTDFGVKDNFAQIYRIIDVFLDSSYPLADDYNGVLQFISPAGGERFTLNPMAPWRATGKEYKKQQVLLDTIEYYDYNLGPKSKPDVQQVRGDIIMKAEVNGSPRLSFSFKNHPLFDDFAFHRCVDNQTYMNARRLEIIPPQGRVSLASYRMQAQGKPPIDVNAIVSPGRGKLDINLTINTEKQTDDLIVSFNIHGANMPALEAKTGELAITNDSFVWKIGRLKPGRSAELKGSTQCSEDCRHVVFGFSFQQDGLASGCELGSVGVEKMDKQIMVGAKYITRAGNFQIFAGEL